MSIIANTTDNSESSGHNSTDGDEGSYGVSGWQRFLPNNGAPGAQTPLALTDRTMVDMFDAAATAANSPVSKVEKDDDSHCACLMRLTDHLCRLNNIERKQNVIFLDTTLYETDLTLHCAEIVLECHMCRLDSKVMLLTMTLLQTVLNWVTVEYSQGSHKRQLPSIHFGDWELSPADGHLIKRLLTNRILATSTSVLSTLHLRMDEIRIKATKQNARYGYMDSECLQQTLQRLGQTLSELHEFAKS
jgi:hypothetical protein